MWLECTCVNITQDQWEKLMKDARPLNYKWLVKKIKKELPDLYRNLRLDLYNPYENWTKVTKTHYILVSSGIEYFINKGKKPYKDEYDELYEFKIRKIIIEEINKLI